MRYDNPSESAIQDLHLPAAARFRHVYVAGGTQYGKSTLLENMIVQDIENDEGLTLLDPKGDLAEIVVTRVPLRRAPQCVFIDIKNPIPINFMGWETEEERQMLLADVLQTFMRFSAAPAGDQWGPVLRWTIHTLTAAKDVSFLDLYYFHADEDRKNKILELVKKNNTHGRYDDIFPYWANQFKKLKSPGGTAATPILNRMAPFITTPALKRILGPSDNPLDIFQAMEDRQIIIVNLMGIGRENGNLVGALLTSKIQQAAFRRQPQHKKDRVPHFFYADEFQNFQTSDFDRILSEAGQLKLSLTLANQGLYQLDNTIKQSIFTNVTGARIAFHLNHEDVSNWKHLLPKRHDDVPDREIMQPEDLANLPPYHAFFKIGTGEGSIAPTQPPLPPPSYEQCLIAKTIKEVTLKVYPPRSSNAAENGTIRTESTPSLQTTPKIHDEEEDEGPTILSD